MEYKMLKHLHSKYLQTEEYGSSEETQAKNEFYFANMTKIEDIVGEKLYNQIEDLINELDYYNHETGFILGFKYAVRLMTECGFKEPVIEHPAAAV